MQTLPIDARDKPDAVTARRGIEPLPSAFSPWQAMQGGTLSDGMPSVNIFLPTVISGDAAGSPTTGG
jgi:hypothetical protein